MNRFLPYGLIIIALLVGFNTKAQTDMHVFGTLSVTDSTDLYVSGDFVNEAGGEVIFINYGSIYLESDIINNGGNTFFINADGRVVFTGIRQQLVQGTDTIRFNKIRLNKAANLVELQNGIQIVDTMQFISGIVFLNGREVDLGTTGLLRGENNFSYFFGFPGSIVARDRFLNTPNINTNIAGMGLYQGSTFSYGQTDITRIHRIQEGAGNGSIERYFVYEPQFDNSVSDDDINVDYFDHELNGEDENTFRVYKSVNNGVVWEKEEGSVNAAINQVEANNVSDIQSSLFTVTVGDCIVPPPVTLGDPEQYICVGSDLLLFAGVKGMQYTWFRDGLEVVGAMEDTLRVTDEAVYSVEAINSNGCIGQSSVNVLIKDNPVLDFSANPVCEGFTMLFNNNSTISEGNLQYFWDFGVNGIESDTAIVENPSYIYTDPGVYTVTLNALSDFGCTEVFMKTVTVDPLPVADFSSTQVCLNETTTFTDQSTIDPAYAITTYLWDFGDGVQSSLQSPDHMYTTSGNFTVTLTITSNAGCMDMISKDIMVDPRPVANFSFATQCTSDEYQFSNTSGFGNPASFFWDFGDGEVSTDENPLKTYQVEGSFDVKMVITSEFGCADSITQTIDVVLPDPLFPGDITTCGTSITLDPDPGGLFTGSSYLWNTGEVTPTIEATSNGVYTVTITQPNTCEIIGSVFVTLNTPITIDLPAALSGCDLVEVDAGYFPLATYSWSDGSTDQSIETTTGGTFTVEVTDFNGCMTSATVNVTVNTSPTVDLGEDFTICNGELAEIDAGNPGFEYLWSDGTTNQTITVGATGTYFVDVTDPATGCTTRDDIQVIVRPPFRVDLGSDQVICLGNGIQVDAGVDNATYAWDSDVGVTGINRILPIEIAGKYWVTVTNEFGCVAVDTLSVTESNNTITASFLVNSLVNVGDTVQFLQLSGPSPTQYFWDFGDGINSTEAEPQHIYRQEGDYDVLLVVGNGFCSDSLTKTVTVRLGREAPPPAPTLPDRLRIENIKLYPNPARSRLNYELEMNRSAKVRVSIVSINGIVLQEMEFEASSIEQVIELNNLPEGMYIIHTTAESVTKNQRFIKY